MSIVGANKKGNRFANDFPLYIFYNNGYVCLFWLNGHGLTRQEFVERVQGYWYLPNVQYRR
jgi:hypothetical protein